MGIVPQEYAFILLLPLRKIYVFRKLIWLKHKQLTKAIDDSLEIMGLSKFANKQVGQFSGDEAPL
jgi:ABC-2 type transport system ATP-binding protein